MGKESMPEPRRGLTRAELAKGIGKFAGGVALFLAIVKSVGVTVAWSRGELAPLEAADGLWIVLLPLWIGVFLRYYSVLRPECGACQLPENRRAGRSQP
jgi:hypothetical protein